MIIPLSVPSHYTPNYKGTNFILFVEKKTHVSKKNSTFALRFAPSLHGNNAMKRKVGTTQGAMLSNGKVQ